MSDTVSHIERIIRHFRDYINLKARILKLDVMEAVALVYANVLGALLIGFIATIALIMLSMAAAFYFAEQLESIYYGFGVVGLFYTFLLFILVIFRKKIITLPLTDFTIKKMSDYDDEEHS